MLSSGRVSAKATLPHLCLVIAYFIYLLFGSIAFVLIERQNEKILVENFQHNEDTIKEEIVMSFLNGSDIDISELLDKLIKTASHPDFIPGRLDVELDDKIDPWHLSSAMLFCMTTITTIGYGDMTPATRFGRAFCVTYALIGVPFSFLVLADIGGLLAMLASRICRFIRQRLVRWGVCKAKSRGNFHSVEKGMKVVVDGNGITTHAQGSEHVDSEPRERRISTTSQSLAGSFYPECEEEYEEVPFLAVAIFLFTYTSLGALGFSFLEDWSFGESVYFTFITLATIGFGDMVPTKHYENNLYIPCMLFTLVGLCFMSMCVTILRKKFDRFLNFSSERMKYCTSRCRDHNEYHQTR